MSKPSSLFEPLISSVSNNTQLHAALSRHLYPALDSLSSKHAQLLSKALRDTNEEFRLLRDLVAQVDLEERRRIFEMDWKAADASQDGAVWRATEEKWLGIIGDWFSTLWQLGVEKGIERALVRECLMFCEEVMCRLVPPSDIVVEWQPLCIDIRIQKTGGSSAYKHANCHLGQALAWMWTELLVGSLVAGSESELIPVQDVVTALQHSSISRELQVILGGTVFNLYSGIPVSGTVDSEDWSRIRREKLLHLRALFFAPDIQSFKASPTHSHFDSLVKRSPGLQDTLLGVTRERVRDNARSRVLRIAWESAAAIYCQCGTEADLMDLTKTLATVPMNGHTLAARLALFKRLNQFHRFWQASSLMEQLLEYTLGRCWLQIAQAYPGWDDAWDWLDEAVQDGRLPKKAKPDAMGTERTQREEQLAQLTALLRHMASGEEDQKPVMLLAGQKRGREEEPSGSDMVCDLRRCLDELGVSPIAVRERINVEALAKSALGTDYLASVDGVYDALCNSTSEPHVLNGLDALRDVLRGKWDITRDCTGPVGVPVERPTKRVRTRIERILY